MALALNQLGVFSAYLGQGSIIGGAGADIFSGNDRFNFLFAQNKHRAANNETDRIAS